MSDHGNTATSVQLHPSTFYELQECDLEITGRNFSGTEVAIVELQSISTANARVVEEF